MLSYFHNGYDRMEVLALQSAQYMRIVERRLIDIAMDRYPTKIRNRCRGGGGPVAHCDPMYLYVATN